MTVWTFYFFSANLLTQSGDTFTHVVTHALVLKHRNWSICHQLGQAQRAKHHFSFFLLCFPSLSLPYLIKCCASFSSSKLLNLSAWQQAELNWKFLPLHIINLMFGLLLVVAQLLKGLTLEPWANWLKMYAVSHKSPVLANIQEHASTSPPSLFRPHHTDYESFICTLKGQHDKTYLELHTRQENVFH